jgi:hypothetical protein
MISDAMQQKLVLPLLKTKACADNPDGGFKGGTIFAPDF